MTERQGDIREKLGEAKASIEHLKDDVAEIKDLVRGGFETATMHREELVSKVDGVFAQNKMLLEQFMPRLAEVGAIVSRLGDRVIALEGFRAEQAAVNAGPRLFNLEEFRAEQKRLDIGPRLQALDALIEHRRRWKWLGGTIAAIAAAVGAIVTFAATVIGTWFKH
jgi:hypothetical protein